MASERRKRNTLIAPSMYGGWIECSVHSCPKMLRSELDMVFPELPTVRPILAVPTCQQSKNDLLQVGPAIADEKDALLERLAAFAERLKAILEPKGYWVDHIDPCSGLPARSASSSAVYSEVDGFEALLRYPVSSAAGCRVILHPTWNSHVYPATVFTDAPVEALRPALHAAADESTDEAAAGEQ